MAAKSAVGVQPDLEYEVQYADWRVTMIVIIRVRTIYTIGKRDE